MGLEYLPTIYHKFIVNVWKYTIHGASVLYFTNQSFPDMLWSVEQGWFAFFFAKKWWFGCACQLAWWHFGPCFRWCRQYDLGRFRCWFPHPDWKKTCTWKFKVCRRKSIHPTHLLKRPHLYRCFWCWKEISHAALKHKETKKDVLGNMSRLGELQPTTEVGTNQVHNEVPC